MQINDKIEIRNGRFKLTDLFYLVSTGFFVILSFFEQSSVIRYAGFSVSGGLFIYFLFQLFLRVKDKTVKIEMSESGIKLFEENLLIPWSKISEIEIIRGKASYFDLLVFYLELTIETKSSIQTKCINLEEYNVDKKRVILFGKKHIEKYFDKEKNEYCG